MKMGALILMLFPDLIDTFLPHHKWTDGILLAGTLRGKSNSDLRQKLQLLRLFKRLSRLEFLIAGVGTI